MITKIVSVALIALLSLLSIPNALANKQFTDIQNHTHALYCAESDSSENKNDYAGDDEEPDCE